MPILFFIFSCQEKKFTETEKIEKETLTIEQQISDIHNIFLGIMEGSNENYILRLSLEDDVVIGKIKTDNNTNKNARTTGLLCKGDGMSFVRCVKDILDGGGCVVIRTCAYCATSCDIKEGGC